MDTHDAYLTLRSIVRVLADSDRTQDIHTVEEVTGREIYRRLVDEYRRTAEGAELLSDKPELRKDQVDYDGLRRLPRHTLGFAYVDHLDRNNITADLQALPTTHVDDPDVSYLMRRFRQTHDVWHALTGLGTVPHHEVIIHAFSYGQLRLPVSALVIFFGTLKHVVLERRWTVLRRGLYEAYQLGRDATPLLPVYWEHHWERPLDEVRARYGVRPCSPDLIN
jgi:ubiquinone biosynthesis protein COQ4